MIFSKIATASVAGLALVLASTGSVFAGQSANSSSGSTSSSQSGSVSGAQSSINAPLTAVSQSGASVSGGFSPKSDASVSNVSPVAGASVEGVSPVASIQMVTNYKATPIAPTPLQTPTGTIPQIFGNTGRTANSAGLGIIAGFLEACHPEVATNGSEMTMKEAPGASRLTTIHWTPYPDYAEQDAGKRSTITHVGLKLPGDPQTGEYEFACLGTLTVESVEKKAPEVDFSTITGDAVRFVGTLSDGTDSGDGTSHVYMLFVPQSISASNGMTAGGWSLGFSPTTASLVGAATSTIGTAAGIGYNKAHAFEKTQIGATYVLVAIKKSGTGGVRLNYHMLEGLYGEHPTLQPSLPKAEEVSNVSHVQVTK